MLRPTLLPIVMMPRMPSHAFRSPIAKVLAAALLVLSAAAAVATAQEGGRIDERGTRLLAEGAGDRLCLTLAEPRGRPMRRCLLPARPGTVRVSMNEACSYGTRLFGIAPAGTRQVNLSGITDGRGGTVTIKLRALRIPTRVHPGGGAAFIVRRSLAGGPLTLTAYDADRRVIAQRALGPIPAPYCIEPKTAVPATPR